jgi:uncharacterized membrane protein
MGSSTNMTHLPWVIQPETLMPYPLHPAVVHFPIVLAVLLPFIAAAGLYATLRKGSIRAVWAPVVAFALLLTASAWVALETGQDQEDRVEDVVSESVIHGHEEAAEGLLAGSAVLAVVVLAGLVPGVLGKGARYAAVPVALVVVVLGFRVGKSGGELVYTHGAAAAYVQGDGSGSSGTSNAPRRGDDDDDDEHRP